MSSGREAAEARYHASAAAGVAADALPGAAAARDARRGPMHRVLAPSELVPEEAKLNYVNDDIEDIYKRMDNGARLRDGCARVTALVRTARTSMYRVDLLSLALILPCPASACCC
jgi:hypothetical protein